MASVSVIASLVITPPDGQVSASTTAPGVIVTGTSSGANSVMETVRYEAQPVPAAAGDDVEAAVYGYIQAIRALGRTSVRTDEIVRALNISLATVERVLPALLLRGVRVA